MSEKIKISVIIPVYNVEKYLNQCVESILNQTYKNIEVILVDDGSKDNSPKICDDYALKDSRVKVVHKSNGGLSSARNCGIRESSGDYLLFIDSDDFWRSQNSLENIVNIADKNNSDVVCYGYAEYSDENGSYGKHLIPDGLTFNNDNLMEQMLINGIYVSSAWTKIIKTTLVKDNDIYFVEGITSEDVDWSARVALYARGFDVYLENVYAYRQRAGSIVHTLKYENLYTLAECIDRCVKLGEHLTDTEKKKFYWNYVAYQYITFFRVAMFCENDSRTKDLLKDMKKYSWLLKYHLNKKVKMIYLANKFLGYNLMYKATKFYFRGK